jgi:hypothetical protein
MVGGPTKIYWIVSWDNPVVQEVISQQNYDLPHFPNLTVFPWKKQTPNAIHHMFHFQIAKWLLGKRLPHIMIAQLIFSDALDGHTWE